MPIKLITASGNATGDAVSHKNDEFYLIVYGTFDSATLTLQCKPTGSDADWQPVHQPDRTAVAVTAATNDFWVNLGQEYDIRAVISGGAGSESLTAEISLKQGFYPI